MNMNDPVEVKLDELGEKIWNDYWARNGLYSKVPDSIRSAQTLPDGWVRFQLWEFASIFGPHLYNGCRIPFETNEVRIPDRA